MKHAFEIHQIKSSLSTKGNRIEVDGRVLEKLVIGDNVYPDNESDVSLTVSEIVTYGKKIDEILPPMGAKIILTTEKHSVVLDKYLFI